MLDGAIRLEGLVKKTREMGMPAVALTDHDNMHGAVRFVRACKSAEVAPILGCEVAFTPGDRADPTNRYQHHLVLLASSQEGYENLVRLNSRGWVEGGEKHRIDPEVLREHHAGVVGLSACMGGYVAQEILQKGPAAGRAALGLMRECFDDGHFFVELQDHGFPEQAPLNEILVELAKELDLPLVASNDCHYLLRDQAKPQLALQAIGAGRPLVELERIHHGSDRMSLRSPEEMAQTFRHLPEAVKNTMLVAEMCGGACDPLSKPKLPRFSVPEGMSEGGFLRKLAADGLAARFDELGKRGYTLELPAYHERLEIELGIIESMGFPGYFLIVQDFIGWAKENRIPVGPARGSGAGSLVAYALRITNIDPIHHGLLFERFLNPERVSMPDFDVDFCMDRRDEVIDYVRRKYGESSVGQIATFHQLKSRSVVRDVGRVMGMSPADAGRIATLIPEPVQGKIVSIEKALVQEPRLKATYQEDAGIKDLLDTAMQLENLNRHAGMHAAGVVISEGPLWDHVPVFCPEPGVYVTQYDKDDVEAAGLVKFDFLGLKTLTVIDIAVAIINKRPDRTGEAFDIDALPIKDRATFALLQSGETTNVFQLESSGMQGLFRKLRPDCFEDIVAAVALYRPGPLGTGMVDDFVEYKHGRQTVKYPHPCLEGILKDTYGVIVFQEQVMQIAREMAGYSLGGADLLRRAMGKKKESEMAKQKAVFVEGSVNNGHGADEAGGIFDLVAHFAGYGFNKSHSAAYALITYQTAYLKAHYPVEFVAATLTADRDKTEKVVRTVAEARSMGITVLPPDVNQSEIDFTVVYDDEATEHRRRLDRPVSKGGKLRDPMNPKIRFGLGGVKGIGGSALEAIFEARSMTPDGEPAPDGAKQPFNDTFDMTSRVDLKRVNKGVVEALVQCGAFDTVHEKLGAHRAAAHAGIEAALERGRRASQDRDVGQTSLFGLLDAAPAGGSEPMARATFPDIEPWDLKELLAREKATLGFYVSGHPLERYGAELRRFCDTTTAGVAGRDAGERMTLGGSVEGYRERIIKSGAKMAFFHLEDPVGRVEVIVRARALEASREALTSGDPILLTAELKFERDRRSQNEDAPADPKLVLVEAALLAAELRARTKAVRVRLHVDRTDSAKLAALKKVLDANEGPCPVMLDLYSDDGWSISVANTGTSVEPSEAFLSSLERLFGEKVCELR